MRRTFKINAVENITNRFNFVPRMSNVSTDDTHILEDNLVYQITFTIGWIDCVNGDQTKLERVDRTYIANVELMCSSDHYLTGIRDIRTPRDFETTDTTKPMRYLSGREVNMLRNEIKIASKFAKHLEKKTSLEIHPWS